MSADASLIGDSADLENLFDSIALAQRETQPEPAAGDDAELEDLFDRIAHAAPVVPVASVAPAPVQAAEAAAPVAPAGADAHEHQAGAASKMMNSVGQLTRKLHDTLAELGYDRHIQELSAATLPDARQRLDYVVTLTEQAAVRSLNAVELALPVQESLATDAGALASRWDQVFSGEGDATQFKALAEATREYLRGVPARTDTTRAHLREVMMAQEFQDLTGQVLKRITEIANNMETQLLKLLVENSPQPVRNTQALGLLNGPAIDGGSNPDVVANQAQVDELLESLGF